MEMNINEVKNFLPHRYPFLLIDRVISFESGKNLTAIKNVSFNEPQFTGHFPDQPIMPGVYTGFVPIMLHSEWKKVGMWLTKLDKIATFMKIKLKNIR